MTLATWFLALAQPLLGRILLSLGFSVVTITGFNISVQALKSQFISSANAMGADILNLFLIAGGGTAAGIVFGAITVRVTLWQISKSTRILGVNPG